MASFAASRASDGDTSTPALSSLRLPWGGATGLTQASLERGRIEGGLPRQQLCRGAAGRGHSRDGGGDAPGGTAEARCLRARGPWRDGQHIVEAERARIGRLRALPRRHDDEDVIEAPRGLPKRLPA